MIWKIWFYSDGVLAHHKNVVYLEAPDFDEALALARKLNPCYNSGCVHLFMHDIKFSHAKARLLSLSIKNDMKCRFNVIEYVCSFSGVAAARIASELHAFGIEIVFDDSSVTKEENDKKRKVVESYHDHNSKTNC